MERTSAQALYMTATYHRRRTLSLIALSWGCCAHRQPGGSGSDPEGGREFGVVSDQPGCTDICQLKNCL